MMQETLRPYVTTGGAVAGAALIALVPAATEFPDAQLAPIRHQGVTLAAEPSGIFAPYVELFTNLSHNLAGLGANHGFEELLTQLFTHPGESLSHLHDVVPLFTTVVPDISIHVLPLPVQISVDMPEQLTMGLAELGAWINLFSALSDVVSQVSHLSDPLGALTALVDAPATLLNAFLNGQSSTGVAGLSIPFFNGLLVPDNQAANLQMDVGQLVNMLGVGDHTVTGLLNSFGLGDTSVQTLLTGLVNAVGYGDKTPVDLLNQLGVGSEPVSTLVTGLLNHLGYGDKTPVELLDQLGVGNQSVATLAIDMLNHLGVGNPSITDLASQAGVGNETVASLLGSLVSNATGVNDPTITQLFDLLGQQNLSVAGLMTDLLGDPTITELAHALGLKLNDMTITGIVTTMLDSAGIGEKTPQDMLLAILDKQLGVTGDTSFGQLLIDMLNREHIDTLSEFVTVSGYADKTVGDLVVASGSGNEPILSLIEEGIGGDPKVCSIANLDYLECVAAVGAGVFPSVSTRVSYFIGDNTLLETLQNLHSDVYPNEAGVPLGTSLADVTVAQLITATGQNNEAMSTVIDNLGLNTTVGQILDGLNPNNLDVDQVVTDLLGNLGLGNTTVEDLFDDWGLNNLDLTTVMDRLGLNNVSVVSLLDKLNLNNVGIDTVFNSLFGTTTVNNVLTDLGQNNVYLDGVLNSLLGNVSLGTVLSDIGLNSTDLDTVAQDLLGNVTVSQVATDIGLNSKDLDQVIAGLGLNNVTVDTLLNDWGVGNLDVSTLLNNLGLSNVDLLDVHIGGFSGLLNEVVDGFPAAIAHALGAAG